MKRFLVVAMALVMVICAFTMVGCGKEGVSYEDFSAKATALKTSDPDYKNGYVQFKFSGDDDYGADLNFKLTEEGDVEISESRMKQYYSAMVWEEIPRVLDTAISYRYAWEVKEVAEKHEKTESGVETKVTVVYQTQNEFSVRIEDYIKTSKGIEGTAISYKKYDATTGYITEYYKKSNTGAEISIKIVWDAK